MIKLKLVWLFIFISIFIKNVDGQTEPIWIGENLSEIYFEDSIWFYQSESDIKQIEAEDGNYYFTHKYIGKQRFEIGFEKLDLTLDTIVLQKKFSTILFIKPRFAANNKFKFYAFEFAVLNTIATPTFNYHLNRYGIFRKSDYKNQTLIEKEISEEKLNEFKKLISKIDIMNMDKAHGRRNNCDNTEYSFTFWNMYGARKNYTAIGVRKQLIPLKEFVEKLDN